MTNSKRNTIVGLFVLIGIGIFGWMVMRFRDLPAFLSSIDAQIITINFPQAPGIEENSPVLFCGYPVGKVVKVSPPAFIPEINNPQKSSYQIRVQVALGKEFEVPRNTIAKVVRRGLGGSYIEFKLPKNIPTQPATMLKAGDKLQGEMSEATEFISENTQNKLDRLITSLTDLSDGLNRQVKPLPPCVVDAANPKAKIHPNLTTVVMRMDKVVKNLNIFLADVSNQHNLKTGLANFAAISNDIRQITKKLDAVVSRAQLLLKQTSTVVNHVDKYAGQASSNINKLTATIQNTADELSAAFDQLKIMLTRVNAGKGTAGMIMNDPRLYESLMDTIENLNNRIQQLQPILENISENGLLAKPRHRPKPKSNQQ